jgi:hypothetical protein
MRPWLASLLPVPTPVIWTGFALAIIWATQPVWSFVFWGVVSICKSW